MKDYPKGLYTRIKQKRTEIDLRELRKEILAHKEEGKKIISHFKKLEEYYSDWEDRFNTIEKKITQAEEDHGLTRDEVTAYDALEDALA